MEGWRDRGMATPWDGGMGAWGDGGMGGSWRDGGQGGTDLESSCLIDGGKEIRDSS